MVDRGLSWTRLRQLGHEVGKFGIVGAIAFVIDVLLFNLLHDPVGPFGAAAISASVAATLAFIGNRNWTWRDRERSGLHREYLLYFIFNAVGLLIALTCLWISRGFLGAFWPSVFRTRLADNISKQIVGTGLGTLFRFWSYRRFVFLAPTPAPAPVPAKVTAD
jgi:putative flippase GtrA